MFIFTKKYAIIKMQIASAILKKGCFRNGAGGFMKIILNARQMTVRDSLKALIEKKLLRFDKFFGEDAEALVTCRVRKGAKIVEIMINMSGTLFRAEAESETFITALDRAVEGLEGQIRKNKTRLEKRMREGAFIIEDEDDDGYDEEGEFNIRVKSFPLKPMSPEEAILQMNLLGHTFYAFTDSESGGVCVVYKRRAGDYGMIVPEI